MNEETQIILKHYTSNEIDDNYFTRHAKTFKTTKDLHSFSQFIEQITKEIIYNVIKGTSNDEQKHLVQKLIHQLNINYQEIAQQYFKKTQ